MRKKVEKTGKNRKNGLNFQNFFLRFSDIMGEAANGRS